MLIRYVVGLINLSFAVSFVVPKLAPLSKYFVRLTHCVFVIEMIRINFQMMGGANVSRDKSMFKNEFSI